MKVGTVTAVSLAKKARENAAIDNLFFENLVTKKHLAQSLEVSLSFISKLMVEEGLPYVKLRRAVRFRVSEIATWLHKRRMP